MEMSRQCVLIIAQSVLTLIRHEKVSRILQNEVRVQAKANSCVSSLCVVILTCICWQVGFRGQERGEPGRLVLPGELNSQVLLHQH